MVKYLLIFVFFVFHNVVAQEDSRRFTSICTGCGYESNVMEYQDGSKVFNLKFNDAFSSAGFNKKSSTAQIVYNEMKVLYTFVV